MNSTQTARQYRRVLDALDPVDQSNGRLSYAPDTWGARDGGYWFSRPGLGRVYLGRTADEAIRRYRRLPSP